MCVCVCARIYVPVRFDYSVPSLSLFLSSGSVRRPLKAVIGTFFRAISIQAQQPTANRSRESALFCKSRTKVSGGLFPQMKKMELPMARRYISLFFLSRLGTMCEYMYVCRWRTLWIPRALSTPRRRQTMCPRTCTFVPPSATPCLLFRDLSLSTFFVSHLSWPLFPTLHHTRRAFAYAGALLSRPKDVCFVNQQSWLKLVTSASCASRQDWLVSL